MRPEQRDQQQQQRGLGLIELALVLAISSIIVTAIYQTFHTQQRTYQQQNMLASMQQNLRASTFIMTRELRLAGYNPKILPPSTYNFGFETQFPPPHNAVTVNYAAQTDIIAFTVDADGDGVLDPVPAELIAYKFNPAQHSLERYNAGSGWQTMAEEVDGVHFAYYDENGVVTINPASIRSVEVSLVIRSGQKDLTYTDLNRPYLSKGGTNICPDCATEPHYRRQRWDTTVQIRNP